MREGKLGKLAILITSGPYSLQNSDTVYQLAKAAIAKGHEVIGIYEQADGVYNLNKNIEPLVETRNIAKQLEELARLGVKLKGCPVCASYRGVLSADLLVDGASYESVLAVAELILGCDRFVSLGY